MADLRIVDAPLLSTVKGTEKIPTGGEGNFSVSVNQVADFAKLKWVLATEGYVNNAVGNVQADLNLHKNNESNPHNVTKVQVGLGNVDNTADLDKPLSNASIASLSLKADKNTVEASLLLKADKVDLTASKILSDGGQTQQVINDFGGAKWYAKSGGYELGATVKLDNGDIVKSAINGNTNDPNVNMTGWVKVNDASQIFDESGKNQQDINNLLKAASYITPREFGGKPNDPEFDNKLALQACSDSKLPILLDGFYYTTESPVFGTGSTIKGIGAESSGIIKVGNNVSDTESIVVRPGVIDNYHVDAILIVKGTDLDVDGTSFAKNVDLDSFSLRRYQCSPVVSVCYGLFAPRIAQSKITNMPVANQLDDSSGVGYAVRVVQGWMLSWDRIDATGAYAFHFGSDTDGHGYTSGGGTSNTFTSCWAAGARISAWHFHGYQYSNLISCGGDYIGGAAPESSFVFTFYVSYMGLINCSTEQVYGRLINANDSSSITVINPHFKHGIYGNGTLQALVQVSGNARLNIIGGEIHPHIDATNPPYRSQYNSILRTQDVLEHFTFSVSKTQNVTDKTQVALFSGNSEFIHEKGGVKRRWAFDPSVLEQSYDENGYKTTRSIELTSQDSTVKLTNFNACHYTNPIQLGRMRVWWEGVNNAVGLYFKTGDDPESETDGTLLNALRGVGSEFTPTRITGQHFIRSDLNKPFWWNGSGWFDALGNGVSTSTTKPTITGLKTPTTLAEQAVVNNSIVAALVTLGLVIDSRT